MNRRRLSVLLAIFAAARLSAQEGTESPIHATRAPGRVLRYHVRSESSKLTFDLPVRFHPVTGVAPKVSGLVEVDPGSPGILHSKLSIDARAIGTGNAARDAVMRNRVLEVAKYPELIFEATSYRGDLSHFGPGPDISVEISGKLTVHGVAQPVRASVDCVVFEDHALVLGAVPVHWREFDLFDPSTFLRKISDSATVIFRLWCEPEPSRPTPAP